MFVPRNIAFYSMSCASISSGCSEFVYNLVTSSCGGVGFCLTIRFSPYFFVRSVAISFAVSLDSALYVKLCSPFYLMDISLHVANRSSLRNWLEIFWFSSGVPTRLIFRMCIGNVVDWATAWAYESTCSFGLKKNCSRCRNRWRNIRRRYNFWNYNWSLRLCLKFSFHFLLCSFALCEHFEHRF